MVDERIKNPCKAKTVKPPKPDQRKIIPWEACGIAAIRAELPRRYQAMADVGSGAGLRQGEVLGLSPDDIDWLRKNIHVRRQVKIVGGRRVFAAPKGGKDRDVPLAARSRCACRRTWPSIPRPPSRCRGSGRAASRSPGADVHQARQGRDPAQRLESLRAAPRAEGVARGARTGERFSPAPPPLRQRRAAGRGGYPAARRVSRPLRPAFTLRVYCHLMPGTPDRIRQAIDRAFSEAPDRPGIAQGGETGR